MTVPLWFLAATVALTVALALTGRGRGGGAVTLE